MRLVKFLKFIYLKPKALIRALLIELPDDFDSEVYLLLHPDVKASRMNAGWHFKLYGFSEGRNYKAPVKFMLNENLLSKDKEAILIVCHEGSLTGAPILSYNLFYELKKKYNVVVMSLGPGPLIDEFITEGANVIELKESNLSPVFFEKIVDYLSDKFKFKFAVVNSIVSTPVLPALSNKFVPSITLVHEFAAYTRPLNLFEFVYFWATKVIFSTNITYQNVISELPYLRDYPAYIIPQGRCLLPESLVSDDVQEVERITKLMRPDSEEKIVILGAGYVQLRKGVDLFLECANRILSSPGGENCKFIWVGKGFDPDKDLNYSVYLKDQLNRAGLESKVLFIGETSQIEAAYKLADMLLITSRLDPLPNVAIDAMTLGLPTLCFEKTTGIADFLIENGFGNSCVARYLDPSDMADKVLRLLKQKNLPQSIGKKIQKASNLHFDLGNYINKIENLAEDASEQMEREKSDVLEIIKSGLFRRDFYSMVGMEEWSDEQVIRHYVRSWAGQLGLRKPMPEFNPAIFRSEYNYANKGHDPFAEYLRAGRPRGRWDASIISPDMGVIGELPSNEDVAVHFHVYYPDLLPDMLARLNSNNIRPDLFISVKSEADREFVIDLLKTYEGRVVEVGITPNRGRDIGPLLTAFGKEIIKNYSYVGHFHTKKSLDVKDANMGIRWNEFLLNNLLGTDSIKMADTILAELNNDSTLGMVFPSDPYMTNWGLNKDFAINLAKKLKLLALLDQFNFPVGTMFWAKTEALRSLSELNLGWMDYPSEPIPYDGSILHAIERIIPLAVKQLGYEIAVTNVYGISR